MTAEAMDRMKDLKDINPECPAPGMTLIDYILKYDKKWAIQVFQNVLSLCGMAPLRLYDLKNVDPFWKEFYDSMEEIDLASLGKDPINVWPELKKRAGKTIEDIDKRKQEAPWVTAPSYYLPLWDEAMKAEELLACNNAFIYRWLKARGEKRENPDTRFIINDYLMMGCKKLDIPGQDWFLIAGPVLWHQENEQKAGEALYKEILKPLIDYFAQWTKDTTDDLSQLERIRMMDIIGNLRPSLDEKIFNDTLEKSSKAFEALLLCEWPESEILSRGMCRELAIDNWTLHTTSLNEIINKLKTDEPGSHRSLENLKIQFPITAHKSRLTPYYCYLLDAFFKNDKWRSTIRPIQEEEKIRSPRIVPPHKKLNTILFNKEMLKLPHFFGRNKIGKNSDISEIVNHFVYFWEWIEKRIESMEIAYFQERLIFFEQWFRQEFGILAARVEEKKPLTAIFKRIAGEIAQLLSADQCDIYRYNSEEEILELAGYFPEEKNIDPIRESMRNIGQNKEKRKRSISYRALDDKDPHFCRAAVKKDGKFAFEPESEEFFADSVFLAQSVIAVPLMVTGRVFGILEVSGFSPFQFRWENRQFLRRISDVISPLVYETLIFHSLSVLTQAVLEFKKPEEDKYRQICEKMRELFMAYAAVLWCPDRENPSHYTPVGWSSKRADLFKFSELKEKVFFDIKDPGCLYQRAFKGNSGSVPLTINIKDQLKDETWHRIKPHRKWLKTENIKEVTHLAINLSKENMLILTLYYRQEGEGLNKQWLQVTEFMSHHTALLLEAVMSQKKWEQGVRNIIHHELKQKVGVILSRTEDVYKFLWKHASREVKEIFMGVPGATSRFGLVFQDLNSYSKSLSDLLDILLDPDTFEKLRRSHTYPLHFIALKQKELLDSNREKVSVNLKRLFSEVFMNTWDIRQSKELSYTYDGPENGPILSMERDHLRTILNNLVDNAIKYAIPKTSIDAKVSMTDFSIEFRLSNYAEIIEDYEEYSIFNENVRGSNAKDKNGQGQGLYLARLFCEIWGGELALEIDRKGNYPLFTFLISFPKQILTTNPGNQEEAA
ncbi:MAG: GAF domain-containing protein [Candidatus Aminicenantes bacterium]|nr:GAF domain-containing protein [Candidatus Aminicenantes bacterium]